MLRINVNHWFRFFGLRLSTGPEVHPRAVVLFLCHILNKSAVAEFRRISAAVRGAADCMVLFHGGDGVPPPASPNMPCYSFSEESLAALPYVWLFQNRVVPGSTHFPLMRFARDFPDYRYYWVIEGDVKFSGSWKRLFKAFAGSDADFLSCHMRRYSEDPQWYWWNTLSHPNREIVLEERLSAFNPIYRLSRQAVEYLHERHCEGWKGHFEVLLPTLLFHGGFRLRDIGGAGGFVASGQKNRFYTSKTMRFRPTFRRVGWQRNKLYHPVKDW